MTTTRPVPFRHMSTSWGDLTASCDHPHRVIFTAGDDRTQLLAVDGFTYLCHVAAYRDRSGDPNPRQRSYLRNGWYTLTTEVRRALSPRGGVSALDRHEQAFIDSILPELADWIVTPTADDLVAQGTALWQHQCAIWSVSTETDLNEALDRVRAIRDAIAAGEIPTDADERYLRYARVQPR